MPQKPNSITSLIQRVLENSEKPGPPRSQLLIETLLLEDFRRSMDEFQLAGWTAEEAVEIYRMQTDAHLQLAKAEIRAIYRKPSGRIPGKQG